jgi:hypothetical protein
MPILASLLVSAFSGLATFLAGFMSQKVAVGLAAASTLGVMIAALLALLASLVNPLLSQLFTTSYGQLLGFCIPPITPTCLAAFSACWAGCTLYSWKKKALDIYVQA